VVDRALWARSGFGQLRQAIREVILAWRTELQAARALLQVAVLWPGGVNGDG
jgi:hypothetical protein